MDTGSLIKKNPEVKAPVSKPVEKKEVPKVVQKEAPLSPAQKTAQEIVDLERDGFNKDKEIKALKAKLVESQQILTAKPGDITAKVNAAGDPAKICIGTNKNGHRVFKKANTLTEVDIERRNLYIKDIKAQNAKRN